MKRKLRNALRALPYSMCLVVGLMLLHSTSSGQQINSPPALYASSRGTGATVSSNIPPVEITVSGKVKDETNQPVPGANVLLKGTTTGTTTDADGAYTLTVPDGNGVLVFSFIGYATQEVNISN